MADNVRRRGPEIQRKVAGEALRLCILGTPVGNKTIWLQPSKARVGYVGGRARANWFVGLGSANSTISDSVDPSGGGATNTGLSAISGNAAGVPIHINNNLPYIIPLNDGHSHQAPVGWIQVAVQRAAAIARTEQVTK